MNGPSVALQPDVTSAKHLTCQQSYVLVMTMEEHCSEIATILASFWVEFLAQRPAISCEAFSSVHTSKCWCSILKQASSPAFQNLFAHPIVICLYQNVQFLEFFVSRPVQAESCGPSPCINLELVRKGGTILYCDYVVSVNCLINPIV